MFWESFENQGEDMNITSSVKLRPTLAGIVYAVQHGQTLLAFHWPEKAKIAEESNLTTVGGVWKPGESRVFAMRRLMKTEYGFADSKCLEIIPLDYKPPVSSKGKQYDWLAVRILSGPIIPVKSDDVASFGWYSGRNTVRDAVLQMHEEKREMFVGALVAAVKILPDVFRGYERFEV